MSEKFTNRYGKRILQCKHAKTLEKTQHIIIQYIRNEGVSHRTIQSYVEKQRENNLQMDRLAITSSVGVQRTKASNYRYAIHRCNSHCQQTLKHDV